MPLQATRAWAMHMLPNVGGRVVLVGAIGGEAVLVGSYWSILLVRIDGQY